MNYKLLILLVFVISIYNDSVSQSFQIAPPPLSVMPPNDYDYHNLKFTYMSISSGDLIKGEGYKIDYYDNLILRKKKGKDKDSPPPTNFECLNLYLNYTPIGAEFTMPKVDLSDPLNPIITEEKVDLEMTVLIVGARFWWGESGVKYDIAGEIIEHKFGFAGSLGGDYYKTSTSGLEDYGGNSSTELWIFRAGIVMDIPFSKYFAVVPFYDYGSGKGYKSSVYGLDAVLAPFENARDWKISLGMAINMIKSNQDKNKFWQISITKEWGKYFESTTVSPY